MSAPWVVWLDDAYLHDTTDYRLPVEGFYGPDKPTAGEEVVPYLRADLTCGECRFQYGDCHKNGLDGPFLDSSLACMAFEMRDKA